MNTPVSFELAKLLKDKSFDEKVTDYYFISTLSEGVQEGKSPVLQHINSDFPLDKPIWSRPTFAEVVMWLYEKYRIWISVEGDDDYTFKFEICNWKWYEHEKSFRLSSFVIGETFWHTKSESFNSVTEAYEAAVDYTLQNLIQ